MVNSRSYSARDGLNALAGCDGRAAAHFCVKVESVPLGKRASSLSRLNKPRGVSRTRSSNGWLSVKAIRDLSIPSRRYSSCSITKTWSLKKCCSCSLARLIHSCSRLLLSRVSNPKMSSSARHAVGDLITDGGWEMAESQVFCNNTVQPKCWPVPPVRCKWRYPPRNALVAFKQLVHDLEDPREEPDVDSLGHGIATVRSMLNVEVAGHALAYMHNECRIKGEEKRHDQQQMNTLNIDRV